MPDGTATYAASYTTSWDTIRTGETFRIVVIQEAGLHGFWIHRVLEHGHEGEGAVVRPKRPCSLCHKSPFFCASHRYRINFQSIEIVH